MLRPGGVIGVREDDQGSTILAPCTEALRRAREIMMAVWRLNGGNPFFAREHKRVLREAGFVAIGASASASYKSAPEEVALKAAVWAERFRQPRFRQSAIEAGLADEAELDRLAAAWLAWGAHPDAFFADLNCEAVAFKPR